MRISVLILLVAVTACSTSSQRTAGSRSVLSDEHWHAPPSVAVIERSIRIRMSGDEFAKLVGLAEPAYISCMTSHLFLSDGILSTRHDSSGRLVWWDIEERLSK